MIFNFSNQTVTSKLPVIKVEVRDIVTNSDLLENYWDEVAVPEINN